MLKKTITYVDFDENERTETHYFHMTRTEFYDWSLSLPEEIRLKLQKAADEAVPEAEKEPLTEQEILQAMHNVRDLVLNSYGEKSEDGRRFIKTEKAREEFAQTEAFEQIYNELFDNPDAVTAFIAGVAPKGVAEATEKLRNEQKVTAIQNARNTRRPGNGVTMK